MGRLEVDGEIVLDGELLINAADGHSFTEGDTFTLVRAGQIRGDFDVIDVPRLSPDSGLRWWVVYRRRDQWKTLQLEIHAFADDIDVLPFEHRSAV